MDEQANQEGVTKELDVTIHWRHQGFADGHLANRDIRVAAAHGHWSSHQWNPVGGSFTRLDDIGGHLSQLHSGLGQLGPCQSRISVAKQNG